MKRRLKAGVQVWLGADRRTDGRAFISQCGSVGEERAASVVKIRLSASEILLAQNITAEPSDGRASKTLTPFDFLRLSIQRPELPVLHMPLVLLVLPGPAVRSGLQHGVEGRLTAEEDPDRPPSAGCRRDPAVPDKLRLGFTAPLKISECQIAEL